MQAAVRSYAAASAALIGAGVVAVNPVTAPHLQQGLESASNAAVRLASTDVLPDLTLTDLENIPYNFIASIANIPYNLFSDPVNNTTFADGAIDYTTKFAENGLTIMPEFSTGAIGQLDDVLAYEGSFWVLNAVNVLGIDPGDPGKIAAFADILSANPEVGSAVAGQLIPILEAELPLQAGCTAASAGGCPDPLEILFGSTNSNGVEVPGYLSVPIQDFFSSSGYTFPGTPGADGSLVNPVPSGELTPPGFPPGTPTDPIPLTGNEFYGTLPWSGENVNFNDLPNAGSAYLEYLTQDPSANPILLPSLTDVTNDLSRLVTGLFNTLNPFVPGTYCLPCAPFVPGDTTNPFTSLLDGFGLGSLDGGSSATLPADLSALFDPSTFTTDIAGLLGTSSTDLTALLGGSGVDLLSSILPDLATFLPF